LIDVGCPEKFVSPKLVFSKDLGESRLRYATLSHYWGTSQPLKTTKETERAYHEEISLESFPRTFQDAICLSRSLRIQYLWIDCPCIVQDDAKEWQEQAARMADIYSDSSLTIAATDSPNCNGGCFVGTPTGSGDKVSVDFQQSSPPLVVLDLDTKVIFLVHIRSGTTPSRILEDSVLNKRAWVLQELALSPRVIHCTREQLCWQCNSSCEDESRAIHHITDVTKPFPIPKLHKMFQNDAHRIWWLWIENYTRRKLSFDAD
jgi:hypothetical protein